MNLVKNSYFLIGLYFFSFNYIEAVQILRPLCSNLSIKLFTQQSARVIQTRRSSQKNNFEKIKKGAHYVEYAPFYYSLIYVAHEQRRKIRNLFLEKCTPSHKSIPALIQYSFADLTTRAIMAYYLTPFKFRIIKGIFDYHTLSDTSPTNTRIKIYFKTLKDVIRCKLDGHLLFQLNYHNPFFGYTEDGKPDIIGTLYFWKSGLKKIAHVDYLKQSSNPYETYGTVPPDSQTQKLSLEDIEYQIKNDPINFFTQYITIDDPQVILSHCINDIQEKTGCSPDTITQLLKRIIIKENTIRATLHPDRRGSNELFKLVNNLKDVL